MKNHVCLSAPLFLLTLASWLACGLVTLEGSSRTTTSTSNGLSRHTNGIHGSFSEEEEDSPTTSQSISHHYSTIESRIGETIPEASK